MKKYVTKSLFITLFLFSQITMAEDINLRLIEFNKACNTASEAIWQEWRPQIKQAIETGNASAARILTCKAGFLADKACEDVMRTISRTPPMPPDLEALNRMQARENMLAHGIEPCPL